MTATEISLIAVTLGFILLLIWVYSPTRRERLESYGHMPLTDDEDQQQEGDRS